MIQDVVYVFWGFQGLKNCARLNFIVLMCLTKFTGWIVVPLNSQQDELPLYNKLEFERKNSRRSFTKSFFPQLRRKTTKTTISSRRGKKNRLFDFRLEADFSNPKVEPLPPKIITVEKPVYISVPTPPTVSIHPSSTILNDIKSYIPSLSTVSSLVTIVALVGGTWWLYSIVAKVPLVSDSSKIDVTEDIKESEKLKWDTIDSHSILKYEPELQKQWQVHLASISNPKLMWHQQWWHQIESTDARKKAADYCESLKKVFHARRTIYDNNEDKESWSPRNSYFTNKQNVSVRPRINSDTFGKIDTIVINSETLSSGLMSSIPEQLKVLLKNKPWTRAKTAQGDTFVIEPLEMDVPNVCVMDNLGSLEESGRSLNSTLTSLRHNKETSKEETYLIDVDPFITSKSVDAKVPCRMFLVHVVRELSCLGKVLVVTEDEKFTQALGTLVSEESDILMSTLEG
eukprot:GHVP01015114.1.p1 GENE.GHVP01015114.1~~GHVP01015114.1.p1  ORF type:complete len:457 (+),score=64.72 GHVP01015114.1:347-1717(+)